MFHFDPRGVDVPSRARLPKLSLIGEDIPTSVRAVLHCIKALWWYRSDRVRGTTHLISDCEARVIPAPSQTDLARPDGRKSGKSQISISVLFSVIETYALTGIGAERTTNHDEDVVKFWYGDTGSRKHIKPTY